MATSESDGDFESADEEFGRGMSFKDIQPTTHWTLLSTVGSESDDDTEYVQHVPCKSSESQKRCENFQATTLSDKTTINLKTNSDNNDKVDYVKIKNDTYINKSVNCVEEIIDKQEDTSFLIELRKSSISKIIGVKGKDTNLVVCNSKIIKSNDDISKAEITKPGKVCQASQQNLLPGAKKLGARIIKDVTNNVTTEQEDKCISECSSKLPLYSENRDLECKAKEKSKAQLVDNQFKSWNTYDLPEIDMPKELKSNKKFKEVFQLEDWEGLEKEINLSDELTEEKLQPVLKKLSLANKELESSSGSWDNWGNWGVTSLINTATAGVSTLTNHVSQGLTLLEDTIGMLDPVGAQLAKMKQDKIMSDGMISNIKRI